MASNPMQRKVRNSFLLGMLITLIIVILIGVLVFFAVIKPKLDEKEKKEEEKIVTYAYRLKAGVNVTAGTEITSNMVESVEIPITTVQTDFVEASQKNATTGELIDIPFVSGYKSKIALTEGTILTYNMLTEDEEVSDTLRYVEYNMITLPTTLMVGDYVDIRLRLTNTQDLIVTTKKQVVNIYDNTVGLYLTEEEILILNSAIVEAYIMTSSELYIATYVEPGLQTEAQYTYSPTPEVVALIQSDENVVAQVREEIANRYYNSGNVRNPINSELNKYSDDKKHNIESGMQKQIEAARQARENYLSELEGY